MKGHILTQLGSIFHRLLSQDQAGNFPTVTRMLLGKIDDSKPGRVSYVYDQYMFHYLVRDASGVL
jgi:hypothetical protein